MVIDGDSCENVVSQEAVGKLGLETKENPYPYNFTWLKKGKKMK